MLQSAAMSKLGGIPGPDDLARFRDVQQLAYRCADLAVREWGDGDTHRPTVVLVHGYPDTSAVWLAVAERLAARYHVVAYDVRGAGASAAPSGTEAYRLERLVEDLAAVIDATTAAAPDRPVHLVGHDWGSIQGWEAVTTEPLAGRIASFTSISGPWLANVSYGLRKRMT